MTGSITFIHEGKPMANPHLGGKHAHQPAKVKGRRLMIAALARDAGVKRLEGAVELSVVFYFEVAKSLSRPKRAARLGTHHIFDPDGSNLLKLVEDALVGVAYHDDNQAASVFFQKIWGETSRTVITVGPAAAPYGSPP